MGRGVPADNISLIDPFLYFSFSIIGLVSSIAIITGLCSVRFRRKSPQPPTLSDPFEMTRALNASTPPSKMEATTPISQEQQPHNTTTALKLENNTMTKELPLPPAMQVQNDSNIPINMKRATSERRLSFNLSLKMPRSLSMARNWDIHKEDNDGAKKGRLKTDESVWMKTIILGEKCNPDEEEDAIIYEGKGKKISAYHPKKSTSMSLSRQWSYIDPDALSVPQAQSNEERINNI